MLARLRRTTALVLAAGLVAACAAAPGTTAEAAKKRPPWTENCTKLNKKYPHGVGRAKARDKTSGDRVTNFRRSTKLYRIAMEHNKGLDRDQDGIACEQA